MTVKSFTTLALGETGFKNLSHIYQSLRKKLFDLAQLTLSKKVVDKMSFG
jgi:hypothetical protein